MSKTNIEWTDATWNPTVGCTRISPGCKNCYAFALHDKRHAAYKDGKDLPKQYAKPFTELQLMADRLDAPLHWRAPRMVFVNSVSDLFHEGVPDDFIDKVFAVMALANQHTFQVLTKRADRMKEYMTKDGRHMNIAGALARMGSDLESMRGDWSLWSPKITGLRNAYPSDWPLPNIWLGVSVESQKYADERIPLLLQTPAAVRFLSCEPLLGPIDLPLCFHSSNDPNQHDHSACAPIPNWVIVGGESGPGARPMHPDWARSIRDQCQAAGVAFFFKQWGEWLEIESARDIIGDDDPRISDSQSRRGGKSKLAHLENCVFVSVGKKAAGRLLDGRIWDEFPTHKSEAKEAHRAQPR